MLKYEDIMTYHMNEGHCSFLTLALLKKFKGDINRVRSLCHFTTHTPVPAGHDHFSIDRSKKILGELLPEKLNLPSWISDNRLHMTELGLYFSRSANGVSELHGEVADNQFPEFSIDYITNGIYHPYWLGKSFQGLFDSKLPGWRINPNLLLNLNNISDDELKSAHLNQKNILLEYAGKQSSKILSSDILTIGFARRAAEYKRARLIFSNLEKLIEIGQGKIQIIFSGKAHPKDDKGKSIIKGIFKDANKLKDSIEIIFLENYNMRLGQMITSGVDVWLNTPLRPNEASGTSGMKAALNGIPNLSILDGWWAEGCNHDKNGWAIGSADFCDNESDAKSLYDLIDDKLNDLLISQNILEMKAFPNPTFDKVIFEGGDPVGIYHVRVVDKLGRVLEQKSLPYQDLVLEMSRYENGTYLVEVVEDDSGKRKIFNIIKSYK